MQKDGIAAWRIDVGDGDSTSAVYTPAADGASRTLFVFAHGAGGHMSDKAMLAAAAQLHSVGLDVLRFNFVYREKKLNRPDPMPRLEATTAAVVQHAVDALQPQRLILGGRSMGGRAASMLVAHGFACDGLLLLAYPLHPAGQLQKLRDAHLPGIRVPVLCFNGTRDPLCDYELMQKTVQPLTTHWTMHWLEGADHSFHVLKSSGRSDADVLSEMGRATHAWLATKVKPRS